MSLCPTSTASEILASLFARGERPFVMSSTDATLIASGHRTLLRLPMADLPAGIREAFAANPASDSRRIMVGALPFRSDGSAVIWEPGEAQLVSGMIDAIRERPTGDSRVAAEPSRDVYKRMVERALDSMLDPARLRKVVLARALSVESSSAIDVFRLLGRLAYDREVTVYGVPLFDERDTTLVGATPELLLGKSGRKVVSTPLAGSARRSRNAGEDFRRSEALLHSEKDRREHASVVESVVERLAPYCNYVSISDGPSVFSTATMWHLGTQIEGEIKDDSISSVDLAVALHPTAAVCGLPREAAAQLIGDLEPFDRGFFSGAVGWCDSRGDGQWMVTIRCAEIADRTARLFAGAGVVPGSDPEMEAAETSAKFETMLRAMGIDETGRSVEHIAA